MHVCEDCGHTTADPKIHYLHLLKDNHPFPPTKNECEICGFVGSTKNKYRERLDHLANVHFKERLEAVIPKARPYACPALEGSVVGKDKQDVLRHYTVKHNTLKLWVDEYICKRSSLSKEMMEEVEPESLNENAIFEKVSNETMNGGEHNNLNEEKRV